MQNRIGKEYGNLIVMKMAGRNRHRQALLLCKCSCGNEKIIVEYHLKAGRIKSCGCERIKNNQTLRLVHGEAKHSKEWVAWYNMKRRCGDLNRSDYKDYGGRGISICREWLHSFGTFLSDMGRAPSSKHSLDRIDNNGNYEKSNCRWATAIEQANNKRNNKKRESCQ